MCPPAYFAYAFLVASAFCIANSLGQGNLSHIDPAAGGSTTSINSAVSTPPVTELPSSLWPSNLLSEVSSNQRVDALQAVPAAPVESAATAPQQRDRRRRS